ncbi:MAG TPA: delta-60 repeat domain-containing protein [Solirubrobacter sp.]|nr:delta-60 repeat domain-containing protein [Solirubrobacter sp.]
MRLPLAAALLALAVFPAGAAARAGEPDHAFGRRGTVTLKATGADAVGGAVRVLSGHRVLAGGAAAGKFVVVRLRASGTLDSRFGTRGQVVPALPGTTLDGVRALAVARDGKIVAAGTLRLADGTTRIAALRLTRGGKIDATFGAGYGYVLAGPPGAELGAAAIDRGGNVLLAGSGPGGVPLVTRLLPDGTPDPAFAFDPGTLTGRVTGILVRPESLTFSVASGAAAFTAVRVAMSGALDPTFAGGVVSVPVGSGAGAGLGAVAIRQASSGTVLLAGTGLTGSGRPQGVVLRLRANGTVDTRFGSRGVAVVARAGRDIRITGLARDARGRILLAGAGAPPESVVVRLRASGRRDGTFGNGGLTYPLLGRPPGGDPIFTTADAIDADGAHPVIAGSAAGPGVLSRGGGAGTVYGGRFALTVSRLR